MKKRVLSMLLAFILCFSTLPMTAFAQEAVQEADAVTEQEEQQEAAPAAEPEEQQVAVPAAEQKEAEAAAAPGEETPSDKSTTVGEAPDTVEPSVESVSDSDAGTQDTGADDEKKAAVQKVQALIDALPETVTEENAERVIEQLEAIDEAMAELTEEQREELNMTRLHAISEALNAPMTVAQGEHADHPVCGDVNCKEHGGVLTEWKPLSCDESGTLTIDGAEWERSGTSYQLPAGNYYLEKDISLPSTDEGKAIYILIKDDVNLCLNGHSITKTGRGNTIWCYSDDVYNRRTFSLCDCHKDGENGITCSDDNNNGTGVYVGGECSFNMYGGTISGQAYGVDGYGNFNMYGGKITNNQDGVRKEGSYGNDGIINIHGGIICANKKQGVIVLRSEASNVCFGAILNMTGGEIRGNGTGGVYMNRDITFNMSGGAITGNNDSGVYTDSYGTFNMTGGKITGNSADNGAGVYMKGTFKMTGGEITGNNITGNSGGSVYVDTYSAFTVSDTAKIQDNWIGDTLKDGVYVQDNGQAAGNVYLTSYEKITIGKAGLKTDASIGVTYADTITTDTDVTVATGADNGWQYGNITSDDPNYKVWQTGNDVKLTATQTLQEHPICGGICTDGNHSKEMWKGISDLSQITSDGNYYLMGNVELMTTWYCDYNVKLCLNGFTITGASGSDAINVKNGKSLDITDCQESIGKITHASGYGRGINVKGTLTLWNGDITGNNGGGVSVSSGSTFTMNGGTITKNKTGNSGGGVYVDSGSTFTMNGGTITGNNAGSNGGGVYVTSGGTFTMNGGTITGNNAGSNGGGVCVFSDSTFTMNGGIITGNNSTNNNYKNIYSGGVYVSSKGSFIVSGEVNITNNWKNGTQNDAGIYEKNPDNTDSKAGNVYLAGVDEQVATITIGAGLTEKAKIGVSKSIAKLDEGKVYIIATGATDENKKYNEIFTSDVPDKYFITSDGEGKLYLSMHQHSLTYIAGADGKTITAICEATGCPNQDNGGSVTIKAPEERTYNGSVKAAKVTASDNWLGMAVDKITISYKDAEGNLLSGAPTDAGTYWASITIGDATASVTYTINGKEVTGPTIEVVDAGTYDGKAKTPSVTVKDGGTVIPSNEYSVSYENNTNAGTATVKITDVAGGNYIVNGSQTFEIDQATITVTPKAGQEKTYGTDDPKLKYNVSGAENNETPAFSGALSRTDGTDVGEYKIIQGTLKLTDGDGFTATNYRLEFSNGVKFNIIPRPVTITGVSAQDKIYDGSADAEITGTAVINGLATGDTEDVKVDATMAHATFENANAGTAKTVNFSGYALTGAKARNYTLSAQPSGVTANINPKELTITDVTVADKTYNGTTEAVITGVSFNGLVNGDSLTKDTDYTVTGTFEDPAAGTGKDVTVTVNLADSVKNYILRNTEYTKNGCKISKAVLAAPADRDFTICNDAKTTYTVMLSELLPSLESPREYGKLTYDDPQLTIDNNSYKGTATVRCNEYEYGKLALTINATGKTEGYIGTITVKVHTDNYEDITLSFKIKATAKTVPQLDGPLTIDPAEITYGKKLGDIKISGTMKDGTEVVHGQFTWVTPDQVLPAGDQSVMWKFTPNFNVQYAEVTGFTTIKVHKIILTGAPDYVVITESGKKLSDAVLKVDDKWPAGTLDWVGTDGNVLSGDTTVEVNTTYKWRFTPANTNYETLTGSIKLYHVDAPAVTVQPKSVSVTVGDTATFEVAATGTAVIYQWQIDRNDGNGFVDITGATGATYTTGVTDRACNGFKYQCVLSNAAGFVITDTVVLTVQYQIIEGANGSWNQNTDGGSLRIRGNGEFSKFQNVKVDGNIIDSKNYTASEGSTIIELHADYLKTLSEGSHTFEIVWTDGAAGTGFTVAKNTSGSNNTGSNNTGSNNTGSNNDNNDSTDNSAAAAPTAAATAQELDKVPATGDPFGIWLTLFAISLTGLAGMLARRKKN